MNIAIVGPGAIGSTFALRLAQAGHAVTVIARGKRLAQLQRDGAIVTRGGARAPVQVRSALEPGTAWDLVLVTVLATQVDAVLPALAASAAKTVMFMFNTVAPLDPLRDVVGAPRFAFGFPAVLATLDEDGALTTQTFRHGQITTVTDAAWAQVFTAAGIPTVVHDDMQSWLRTHAALVVPFMITSVLSHRCQAGLSWAQALHLARALHEGFALVLRLGSAITPAPLALIRRAPAPLLASLLWISSRLAAVRKMGVLGPSEPRALIDAMAALSPGQTPLLRAAQSWL